MKSPSEIHDEAMLIMNQALDLQRKGDNDASLEMFSRACDLEAQAANKVENRSENEPSRSMLYLGAASLAFQAQEYERAGKFIEEGMKGYPPIPVIKDFLQLRKDVQAALPNKCNTSSV
jgi:uncharacterized protein HemY